MDGFQSALYDYILVDWMPEHLRNTQYKMAQRQATRLYEQLEAALPEEFRDTLIEYADTISSLHGLELDAMFQAAFAAARELS